MRIVKWSLVSGGKPGQETKDIKKQEGLSYIERLKKDERVISVEETDKELIINLE